MPGFIQPTADNRNSVELTEVTFWDNYWRDCPLPRPSLYAQSTDRSFAAREC